jgi:hypothetical protein
MPGRDDFVQFLFHFRGFCGFRVQHLQDSFPRFQRADKMVVYLIEHFGQFDRFRAKTLDIQLFVIMMAMMIVRASAIAFPILFPAA